MPGINDLNDEELYKRSLMFDPSSVSGASIGPGRAPPGAPPPTVSGRELAAGLRDANVITDRTPEDDHVDASFNMDPNRPQFRSVQDNILMTKEGQREADRQKELDEIDTLMKEFESRQAEQKQRSAVGRMQAFGLRAGQAMSSGMGGLKQEDIPIPAKYDVEKGAKDKIELGDKLKNSKEKWENMQLERDLKDLLNKTQIQSKEKISGETNQTKKDVEDQKIDHDIAKTDQLEGGRLQRTKITAAAGLGGKALGINAQANSQGARADSEFANRQAERQVAGWKDTGAHSQTDETKGAHLAGAEASVQKIGRETVDTMRREGRNFPQSAAWQKLESSMSVLHEDLNKLHEEGVMNFGDKGNRIVESGDPQSFKMWIMQIGPDVLEHALNNISKTTDERMRVMKYERDPNWKSKMPSDYLGQSSGGGRKQGMDPNDLKKIGDWSMSGGHGPLPELGNPNNVKAPEDKNPSTSKGRVRLVQKNGKWVPEPVN